MLRCSAGPVRDARAEGQRVGVCRQQVEGPADHVCRVRTQNLKEQLCLRLHGAVGRDRRRRTEAGGAGGETTQVLALVVGQFQCTGESVYDLRAGAGLFAALEASVVIDADPREGGEFRAAQTGRAPRP